MGLYFFNIGAVNLDVKKAKKFSKPEIPKSQPRAQIAQNAYLSQPGGQNAFSNIYNHAKDYRIAE